MLERIIPFLKKPAAAVPILAFACLIPASAQPTPAPASGDLPCKEDVDVVTKDTVAGVPDAEGYLPLFDGSFKGWFQSCKTSHSNNSNEGAIFRIGQADGKPAIYSTQRGTSTGGVMMTNKKFTNYEITFQTWPDYGNDAGLFNRRPSMAGASKPYWTTSEAPRWEGPSARVDSRAAISGPISSLATSNP
jgi:hypothetical protein